MTVIMTSHALHFCRRGEARTLEEGRGGAGMGGIVSNSGNGAGARCFGELGKATWRPRGRLRKAGRGPLAKEKPEEFAIYD